MKQEHPWAVVLAGGDGTRLQSLTRLMTGEDRPKQFCRLYGGSTLLAHTRSRLAHAVSPEQTVFAVVKQHERFYADELSDVAPSRLVVQPSNKGTTAAIAFCLHRIAGLAGDPIVGFFPTDHYYSRELRFVSSVRVAIEMCGNRPATVILLGANAAHPEADYGWIEPGARLECQSSDSLFRVTRFWEKPPAHVAQALLRRGCLWNTFVMIGRVSAFLAILRAAAPRMVEVLGSGACLAGARMAQGDKAYAAFAQGDFSQQVLSVCTRQLAVLRLVDAGWSDLGTPERVMFAMRSFGLTSNRRPFTLGENAKKLAKTLVSYASVRSL